MGGNPSVSELVATLHQLHDLISADAAKATGKIKTYYTSLAKAADSTVTAVQQYSGILSKYTKQILTSLVDAIGVDWQAVQTYAGCIVK